jgi:putative DNA primase/helicase
MRLALAFAEAGYPVIPVKVFRRGNRWRKEPYFKDWAYRATTDANLIKLWWERWPLAMVGVPLARCRYVVVDADRHGGGQTVSNCFAPLAQCRRIQLW